MKRVLLVWLVLMASATEAEPDASFAKSAERGHDFLVGLYDEEVHLLPEFRGHHVYWLYHDNYLVTKVLKQSHPERAAAIAKAIAAYGENQSGKIERISRLRLAN